MCLERFELCKLATISFKLDRHVRIIINEMTHTELVQLTCASRQREAFSVTCL